MPSVDPVLPKPSFPLWKGFRKVLRGERSAQRDVATCQPHKQVAPKVQRQILCTSLPAGDRQVLASSDTSSRLVFSEACRSVFAGAPDAAFSACQAME